MQIDEKIFQMARRWGFEKSGPENDALFKAATREALAEQAATHAIELLAYEAAVQNQEQRIRDLQLELLANGEAQRVLDVRCKCCGYLVTESEHKGCLRAADATVPEGFVMVPVVPTADQRVSMRCVKNMTDDETRAMYEAAIRVPHYAAIARARGSDE